MNHIQIYDNALPKESCRNIIKYFDNHPDTGIIDDTDVSYSRLTRRFNSLDSSLDMLIPTLVKGITKYKKKFTFLDELSYWDLYKEFNIQKFDGEKNGYFMRHCEADGPYTERMLAWMVYLNNAQCGTEFMYYSNLKAKRGRCAIWPSGWQHTHRGVVPNKGVKYIATGWVSFDK